MWHISTLKTGPDSFIKYLIEHLLCARHLGNISEQVRFLDQFFRVIGMEEQIIKRPKGGEPRWRRR